MQNVRVQSTIALLFTLFLCVDAFSAQTTSCDIFPSSNIWNTKVTNAPVHKESLIWLNAIGKGVKVHPDFGSKRFNKHAAGIPINYTNKNTKRYPVLFKYKQESDLVEYPIPKYVKIEGGISSKGDRHILSLDTDECILYELFNIHRRDSGVWTAGSGAVFDLTSNNLRPDKWTSADAAGLPIYPGLVRYDEVKTGIINHALRFTVRTSNRKYLWPARHFASRHNNPNLPPMGMRLRLKPNIDLSNFSPQAKVIATALKTYGMILADNGGSLFISGEPNKNWNNWGLKDLKKLVSNDFEVVDTSALQVHQDSATTNKNDIYKPNLSSKKNLIIDKSTKKYKNKAKYYTDFYVSPYGHDSYDGTNERPWKTLQHAADLSEPGDTINIEKGSYSPFKITKSGTKDHPIIFNADGATIDAFSGAFRDGIEIRKANHITIKGFKVHHANRAGISAVTCSDITIEWNELLENKNWGIFTGFCSNLVIRHNVTAKSKNQHGIYVSNTSSNIQIYNNHSFDNPGAGIQLNADKHMGGKGVIKNVIIYNNDIHHNGSEGGAAINLDGVQHSKIFNNLVYNNSGTGIAIFKGDAAEGSKFNQIIHNTIAMPSSGRWCVLFKNESSNNVFKNNICENKHSFRGSINIDETSKNGFISDHNLLTNRFTFDDGETVVKYDHWLNSINQDKNSHIINKSTQLFRMDTLKPTLKKPNSVKNKGVYMSNYDLDYYGKARKKSPDIGAIQSN